MYSGTLSYQLPSFMGLMRHDESEIFVVRDEDVNLHVTDRDDIHAQVRSGDYFVTLATILDGFSRDIDTYAIRVELENLVSDLIYLQENYTITKNEPPK